MARLFNDSAAAAAAALARLTWCHILMPQLACLELSRATATPLGAVCQQQGAVLASNVRYLSRQLCTMASLCGYAACREGFDKFGFNKDGFDKSGFNVIGMDKNGFDAAGFNILGFDKDGYNKGGFNAEGYNR
jgi:hypothetical protein